MKLELVTEMTVNCKCVIFRYYIVIKSFHLRWRPLLSLDKGINLLINSSMRSFKRVPMIFCLSKNASYLGYTNFQNSLSGVLLVFVLFIVLTCLRHGYWWLVTFWALSFSFSLKDKISRSDFATERMWYHVQNAKVRPQ